MRHRLAAVVGVVVLALTASTMLPAPQQASAAVVFSDGFESGTILPPWSSSSGLVVQSGGLAHTGSDFARSTASVAWASKTLAASANTVETTMWFRFESRQDAVSLVRLRTPAPANLVRVFVTATGRLALRNERTATTTVLSGTTVASGAWQRLDLRVTVAGTSSTIGIDLNSTPVHASTASLGSDPVGRVEVGNRLKGKTFDLLIDDVSISDAASAVLLPPSNVEVQVGTTGTVAVSWSTPDGIAPDGYRVYRDNELVGTPAAPVTAFTDSSPKSLNTRYVYVVQSVEGANRSAASTPAVATMPDFTPGLDAVVYAAGDIACKPTAAPTATTCHHPETGDIVAAGAADAVLPLGDLQYEKGQLANFKKAYDATWGRAKGITYPIAGNHEYYLDDAASGYDGYFLSTSPAPAATWSGSDPYYSFDIAGWHFVALNSNCAIPEVGGCAPGSPQYDWLQQDLSASDAECTIGYWHHSRFSSAATAARRDDATTSSLWSALDTADAELVLVAHQHFYERLAPMTANGTASATGLRSFVVGTGGRNFDEVGEPLPASERLIDGAFGVLKLTLHAGSGDTPGSYDYAFVPELGATATDEGSVECLP